ncbi:hypothetical protein F4776DRAFT_515229 [Hypoxylon sp. NC0597]|nr:hypothetical protein F4776DRAFT_515229 [Hypoxylon sp. NC0597]
MYVTRTLLCTVLASSISAPISPLQSWSEHQITRLHTSTSCIVKPPPSTEITAATSSWLNKLQPARLTPATIRSKGPHVRCSAASSKTTTTSKD